MSDVRFLIDLTTSREYKGQNPVGIVRTEREIAKAFLDQEVELDFFWFDAKAAILRPIRRHEAAEIVGYKSRTNQGHLASVNAAASIQFATGDKVEMRKFLDSLAKKISHNDDNIKKKTLAEPESQPNFDGSVAKFELFDHDVVISAGLLWDGNYLEILYKIKKTTRFFFMQIVYDIVPMVMPEFCVPGMNVRFPRFILDAAWTADAIYSISDNTMTDLNKYLVDNKLPRPQLERITLGADLVPALTQGSSAVRDGLAPNKFVVYVSTIEPRKNHIMLFHVWRQIFLTNPDDLLTLVIIGRHGWNASDVINIIQSADHLYPEYIRIMTEVSDADLNWLYINARFSVYPSLYEGWGLPVAESLIRGKFCIASSTSSLPEVACGLAALIDPLNLPEWIATVHHYMIHDDDLAAKERAIKESYRPVSWDDAMQQFVSSITRVTRSLVSPSLINDAGV